jgi:hypothetical protein
VAVVVVVVEGAAQEVVEVAPQVAVEEVALEPAAVARVVEEAALEAAVVARVLEEVALEAVAVARVVEEVALEAVAAARAPTRAAPATSRSSRRILCWTAALRSTAVPPAEAPAAAW